MNSTVATCRGICKSYGDYSALLDIDIVVPMGEIFGIIGPDGAGKTSLFRILSTLLLADSGQATVLGFDVVKDYKNIRKSIGFMPGRFSLYQDLTVEENLSFYASVFGVSITKNYFLIKDIYSQLEPFKSRKAGNLSGGMKQKLALSCALIHKPDLLILDEPTTGVDAVSRKEFWDHLYALQKEGMTILVATPYMDEAERCDCLTMLQKGKILDSGTPKDITSRFAGKLYQLTCPNRYQALLLCQKSDQIRSAHTFGQTIHLTLKKGITTDVRSILTGLGMHDIEVREITPSIEDCFMQLMS